MFANENGNHEALELNLPPAQRGRIEHSPVDVSLIGNRCMRTEEIQIKHFLDENIEQEKNLRKTHLLVQILRIITPQAGNSGNAMTR